MSTDPLTGAEVQPHDHWSVTVTIHDEGGGQATGTASVTVPNRPPILESVHIHPEAPRPGDSLQADAVAIDPDNDKVTFGYQWVRNGDPQPDLSGSTVPEDRIHDGDTWTVHVTASDTHGATDEGSASVTVNHRPPVIHSVAFEPDPPRFDTDLQVVIEVSHPDDDKVSLDYAWARNDEPRPDLTGPKVPVEELNGLDTWSVTITATDERGAFVKTSESIVIPNRVPVIDAITFNPDPPDSTTDLQVVVDAWDPDDHETSLEYAWDRYGVAQPDLDGPVVPSDRLEAGDEWSVTVTARDEHGATATSDLTVTIAHEPPVIQGIVFSPDPPEADVDLEADVEVIYGGDEEVSVEFQWENNGILQEGLDGPKVPRELLNGRDLWGLAVTVTDEHDRQVSKSVEIEIPNRPPTIHSVQVSPEAAVVGETVEFLVDASDPDGDPLEIVWTFADGTWLEGEEVSVSFDEPGEHPVTVEVSDGLDGVEESLFVVVSDQTDGDAGHADDEQDDSTHKEEEQGSASGDEQDGAGDEESAGKNDGEGSQDDSAGETPDHNQSASNEAGAGKEVKEDQGSQGETQSEAGIPVHEDEGVLGEETESVVNVKNRELDVGEAPALGVVLLLTALGLTLASKKRSRP